MLEVDTKVFEGFERDYIKTMLDIFGKDTRWFSITEKKERIENLNLTDEKELKELEEFYKFLKKSLESASYKAGFEIAKSKDDENPYEYIEQIKSVKTNDSMKKNSIKIIDYLKKHKEIYCMKDIMYNKINMFWENVAFLNRNANTKDIEEEYKKTFVVPVLEYLKNSKKSDYNCIECSNMVSKSEATSMSWLKDVGVDINRKKSGFWNFVEDTFLCPVCSLIYSCAPLGFYILGRESIFINQNNNMKMLRKENAQIEPHLKNQENNIEHSIFLIMIEQFKELSMGKIADNEIHNIQVIKRTTVGDKIAYEFTTISKEKLRIFKENINSFEKILGKKIYINDDYINIYEQVMSNFLNNRNQYELLYILTNAEVNNSINTSYKRYILDIQINSMGGLKMEEKKEISTLEEKILWAGRELKNLNRENANKLRAYVLQLTNSLRTNNPELFMDIVTRMYGGLSEDIPYANAFAKMLTDSKYFRCLGYAYVIGLEAYVGDNDKEGNRNEE